MDTIFWSLMVLGIIFVIFMMSRTGSYEERLMKECMSDGHKEYECVSMIYRRGK